MTARSPRMRTAAFVALPTLALALGACSAADDGSVSLTLLTDNTATTVIAAEAVVDAFTARNPDIDITVETRPGGSEGDNVVKTRLATGEMTDLFQYNAGSLLVALHPDATVIDLRGEVFLDDVSPDFLETVSTADGTYGVPFGTALAGGILYNVRIYEELGLTVPTTWDEFMANSRRAAAAGYAGVIQTYGDTWTSQILVLADFYNVISVDPAWATEYTAGRRAFAGDPAVAGFEHLQEVHDAGLLNRDFASATYEDGLRMLAAGEGAHYPMLTSAISALLESHPEAAEDVGFFALPGDGPANGLTTWTPLAIYGATTTRHPEAVERFLAFLATPAACDAQTAAIGAVGPYLVQGCELPAALPRAVSDVLAYFETAGGARPALEFLSPVKGPALEHITVEVGSGIRSAVDGAERYDEDIVKQAQQLGLEGW